MCNNYVTYIVAMQLDFCQIQMAALSIGVATASSLAQFRVQDTKKQRQCRCDDRGWKCQKQPATHDAYKVAN